MARWGRAGIRLTEKEAAARDAKNRAAALRNQVSHEADMRAARQAWEEGRIIPASITVALDAQGLYGPQVDEACGAREPDVDRWEAGVLYPTWEQLVKLASLCKVTPRFFTMSHERLDARDTSMRFHTRVDPRPPRPVLFFTAEAIAAVTPRR